MNRLPSFIIIGVIKGGTSGLYWNMMQHPKILPATKKELIYFQSNRYKKDLSNYKSFFPNCTNSQLTGEATPSYILYEEVAKRIAESLPNIKLIVLLRNPITRAYSQYYHAIRNYKRGIYPKPESFAIMIQKELNNKATYPKHMGKDLINRGLYINQLSTWFKYNKKNQFKIIKSEDYFNKPNIILNEVFEFLELESYEIKDIKIPDQRIYPKSIDKETKDLLKEYYNPYNHLLYNQLKRDMKWEEEI